METILKQRTGKISNKNGKARLYLEESTELLNRLGFKPGNYYEMHTNIKKNEIVLEKAKEQKGNIIIKRTRKLKNGMKKELSVIDKSGEEIREALKNCSFIKITFVENRGHGKVLIQGIKNTAQVLQEKVHTKDVLKNISFCAGSGISSKCMEKSGFVEVAFCEYNSKDGAENKFSEIFKKNSPDAVEFNIPMEQLKGTDLPFADVWLATLDCSDFSKLASNKKEFKTMHLFMHLMRLFWERPIEDRPSTLVIENTPNFEHIAGNSLKLCLEEQGFFVNMAKLNSLDFGSRTKRERFFFVASIFDGFSFPEPTGRIETPIINDGIITLDNLDWITPEDSSTLKYYIDRQKNMKHNYKIISYDITKDSYVGTIVKNHSNFKCENLIKHPTKENTYARILNIEHLKYLHNIDKDYYLGDSKTTQIQSIGQGVCCKTFQAVSDAVYKFLVNKLGLIQNITPHTKNGIQLYMW